MALANSASAAGPRRPRWLRWPWLAARGGAWPPALAAAAAALLLRWR